MTQSDHAAARDRELLAAVGQGMAPAFETIYHEHKDRLLTVAFHMTGDRFAAEDVLQDVFVTLVRRARRLQLRGSMRQYLLASVLNRCRDLLRRSASRRPPHEAGSILELDTLAAPTPTPDESALAQERAEGIARALHTVPDEQREVVVLHLYEEMTFREIAEMVAIPPNTAQSRYRYAMAILRERLAAGDVRT